jgi:hypothetical protein
MKPLFPYAILVILLIALTSNSCKKEKDEEPFIGKWEFQSSHVDIYVNDVYVKDTIITYDAGDLWIEFNTNNTGVFHDHNAPYPFTWSASGNIITLQYPDQCALYLDYTLNEPTNIWTVKTCPIDNKPNSGDVYYEIRTETTKSM